MSKDHGFFQTTLAHELDPTAEPGSRWATLAASAAYALRLAERRGKLPPVPIEPAKRATLEKPGAGWSAADDKRLEFALRLLRVVESGDSQTLVKLAECIAERRKRGIPPNPTMRVFEELTRANMRAGIMDFPNKGDVQETLERDHSSVAPRSKKSKWRAFKHHAIAWLKQRR